MDLLKLAFRCFSNGRRSKAETGVTDDFKGMSDDADSHELLAVVAAVHHEGVRESLDDGTLCFSESLDGIPAGGVRDVDW